MAPRFRRPPEEDVMIRANTDATNVADLSRFVVEEVTDPAEIERARSAFEHSRRNMDWLEAHWPDLLPQALGKFVAVAGQEAFVADSGAEARARARAAHPEDRGLLVQYVRPEKGPRIYGNRR
jgi:hypothetical protein